MFLAKFFAQRGPSTRARRAARSLVHATCHAIEELESRRLLSTYIVPSGTSFVQLSAGTLPGEVKVFLDHGTTASHTFTNLTGPDVVQASGTGVTCQDTVPAAKKEDPTNGVDISIQFISGSTSTLEIDAGPTDQLVSVTASTSTSATIQSYDATDNVTATDSFGTGVNKLMIVTNDAGGAHVYVPTLAAATTLTVNCGSGTGNTIDFGNTEEGETVTNAVVNATAGSNTVNVRSDGDDPSTASIDLGDNSGNLLMVLEDCVATLADHIGDGHTVTVDTVTVGIGYPPMLGGTLLVASKSALGTTEVMQNGDITVQSAASGTTFTSLQVDAASPIANVNGTADIEAPVMITSLSGGGTVTFTGASGDSTVGRTDETGSVTVDSGANVIVTGTDGSTVQSIFNLLTVTGNVYLQAASTISDLEQTGGLVEFTSTSGSSTVTLVNSTASVTVDAGATVTFVGTDGTTTESAFNLLTVAGNVYLQSASTVSDLEQSAGLVDFTSASGSSTVTLVNSTGNVTVEGGATVTFVGTDGTTTESTFNLLTVAGDVYLQSASMVTTLTQSAGLVKLDRSGTWRDTGHAFGYTFSTITITGGQLDVNGQDLLTTVSTVPTDPYTFSTLFNYLYNGYDGGDWAGSGITSSYAIASYAITAPSPSHYAVAYATASDNGRTGLSLTGGQVLLRPTRVGDVNLDGTTALADYNALATNLNHSPTDWSQGDFDYDNATGLDDYNLLAANFNQSFPT